MADITVEDIVLTQQLYAEAVKNEEGRGFDPYLDSLLAAITTLLGKQSFDKFNEVNKKTFNALLSGIVQRIKRLLMQGQSFVLDRLYKFMAAEIKATRYLVENVEGKRITQGPYAKDTKKSLAPLWAGILAAIIPASGQTTKGMMATFVNSVINDVRKTVSRAWAEGWTAQQIINEFTGARAAVNPTSRNTRNGVGLIKKFRNNFQAMIETQMQSIINRIGAGFWSIFYDNYRWVSVIDTRTTDICRSRDGRVYAYSDGPRPPAHYRCRSRMVPTRDTVRGNGPDTFMEWVVMQPQNVQDFANNNSENENIRTRRRLTLEQYLARTRSIVN